MTPCPYTYAREHDIQIKKYDFEEFSGICGRFGDNALIGIKDWYDIVTEREILWHELGHFLSGTENNIHFSKYDEQKADRFGRDFLIPRDELERAIEDIDGNADASILAMRFGVSIETMMERIRDLFRL